MELVYLSVYKCSSKQCYVKIILTIYGPTLYVYDDDEFLISIINYIQPHPVKNSGYHLTQRTKQRTKYPNSYTPHSSTPFTIRPVLLKELIVICSWKSARTTYHYWTTFVRIFFIFVPTTLQTSDLGITKTEVSSVLGCVSITFSVPDDAWNSENFYPLAVLFVLQIVTYSDMTLNKCNRSF